MHHAPISRAGYVDAMLATYYMACASGPRMMSTGCLLRSRRCNRGPLDGRKSFTAQLAKPGQLYLLPVVGSVRFALTSLSGNVKMSTILSRELLIRRGQYE